MDLLTILAVIPGIAPLLPYIAAAIASCAALAVILAHPTPRSGRLYVLAYNATNFVALNFGRTRNAPPAPSECPAPSGEGKA
ncbi:MAG: hypothetical protein ACJ8AI_32325 [Rhodopila sp.]